MLERGFHQVVLEFLEVASLVASRRWLDTGQHRFVVSRFLGLLLFRLLLA